MWWFPFTCVSATVKYYWNKLFSSMMLPVNQHFTSKSKNHLYLCKTPCRNLLFLEKAAIIKCFSQETQLSSMIKNYPDLKAGQKHGEWSEEDEALLMEGPHYNSALFAWEAVKPFLLLLRFLFPGSLWTVPSPSPSLSTHLHRNHLINKKFLVDETLKKVVKKSVPFYRSWCLLCLSKTSSHSLLEKGIASSQGYHWDYVSWSRSAPACIPLSTDAVRQQLPG